MRASYHWYAARLWAELAVLLDWDYALQRSGDHIDAWVIAVGPENIQNVLLVGKRHR